MSLKFSLRSVSTVAVFAVCFSVSFFGGDVFATEADLEVLLDGVSQIAAPGVPGPLCAFGRGSFVVATAPSGDVRLPVVVAGRMVRGRVVAFGHTGYFDGSSLASYDTGKLMANAVRWSAGRSQQPRVAVRKKKGLLEYLKKNGINAEVFDDSDWAGKLRRYNVLCISPGSLSTDAKLAAVSNFIRSGGGVIFADLGWGWSQINSKKSLWKDHAGNRLLSPMGIVWTDGYLRNAGKAGYELDGRPSPLTHAMKALDALENDEKNKTLDGDEVMQAAATLSAAARSVPANDRQLMARLWSIQRKRSKEIVPTHKKPLKKDRALDRVVLTLQLQRLKGMAAERISAHPASREFPGVVPYGAKGVSRTVRIDGSVKGWHSTGLYAPAGKVVRVSVPRDAAGKGLKVRIGCHRDRLWGKDSWRRCPEICNSFAIEKTSTTAANAFGGLVYIEVPSKFDGGTIAVKVSNGIEAPYYVLGETDLKQWRDTIRKYPAPWAELETDKVILTVPSKHIRALDDPEELMVFWDRVMDACADLSARPRERTRPERYVPDEQISAGYMHSGYPIMTHLDAAEPMVNLAKMKGGRWGLFHEVGHNHQSGAWTFSGTGEVTVNLFSLYILDTVCGEDGKLRSNLSDEARTKKRQKYFADGRKFEKWKSDPFLALDMYMQLQEAFGWEAYKKVFAEYRDLPRSERPKNDDEERDQWLVRMSKTVGRNLGPFFEAWGVPTSPQARKSVASLPGWMPESMGDAK